jgi:restriction system protein
MATKSDLPDFEAMFKPAVDCFRARGGSMTIEEMEDAVAAAMKLSDDIRAVPHADGPRKQFDYELAWVRTYLKKVGALENSERGVWRLTASGAAMSDGEIALVKRQVRDLERARRRNPEQESGEPDAGQEAEDDAGTWRDRLLTAMLAMKPDAFERLCQRILRESGFTKVEVTGRTGDGGIDGTGVLRLNLLSFHVLFQSKRYKGFVSTSEIRDFRGAMVGRADKGLFITTGTFTADARREATRDGAPAIDLIDGDALCDLLKSLRIGVAVRLVEEVEIDPGFFAGV